jgi:CubicO group peptidase (beta-lactamase class C family)
VEAVFATTGRERERWGIPALALGLLVDGSVETRGFGVEPEERFRIASITKPFVARLAARALDLDAPIETPAGPATPRQLLSHQAGLACERSPDAEIVARGRPGLFAYSNSGYWLVGEAIAGAAGTSFEEAMHAHVLDPLGLGATGFEGPHARGHEPVAPGALEHRPFPTDEYPRRRRPSGGLISTVGDLLRFAEAELDSAFEPLVPMPGGMYGLGWMLERRGGETLALHSGSIAGFESLLLLVPGRSFALAALSNSARGSAAIGRVADAALGELGLPRPDPGFVELPREALAAFAGRYGDELESATVSVLDGGLLVEVSYRDVLIGEDRRPPPLVARPVASAEFVVTEGEQEGERFDFAEGFLRLGSMLAERAES